jgi:hypothetical protein
MIQLLIDGHNLIPRVPGLSLSQIDDEERLVGLLRKYATHHRAQIVVVFDSGNLAGRSRDLSGWGVEVYFAGSSTNADRILIERMRDLKHPQQWKLVSSDRAIQEEANRRRVRVVEAADFAHQLMSTRDIEGPTGASAVEKPDTETDIDEWLKRFKRT